MSQNWAIYTQKSFIGYRVPTYPVDTQHHQQLSSLPCLEIEERLLRSSIGIWESKVSLQMETDEI